jgi:hypothetical protein
MFNENHKYSEDIFPMYKILKSINKISIVSSSLYNYRIRENSLTRSDKLIFDETPIKIFFEIQKDIRKNKPKLLKYAMFRFLKLKISQLDQIVYKWPKNREYFHDNYENFIKYLPSFFLNPIFSFYFKLKSLRFIFIYLFTKRIKND